MSVQVFARSRALKMHDQANAKTVPIAASGGVIIRRRGSGNLEVVICGRRSPQTWSLPKGKPEPGESVHETAAREVREETGLEVEIQKRIGDIHYSFMRPEDGAVCNKTVTFYLMRPTGGDMAEHDPEFDDVQWVDPDEARTRLTYPNETRILEKAVALAAGEDAPRA